MRHRVRGVLIIVAVLTCFVNGVAIAQDKPADDMEILRERARADNIASASYGLQAGVQVFGYALFFMTDSAVRYLSNSGGFELGVGPSVVVLDAGAAKALTTTTAQKDCTRSSSTRRG